MKLHRNAPGYGGIGLTWALGPLGNTVIIGIGKWFLRHHWATRAQRKELDLMRRAASDLARNAQERSEK